MIVGLGIDVASVERFARSLERFGDKIWQRILTPAEQADLAPRTAARAQALAGRFAAKEAAIKALGGKTDVTWRELEIRRGELGAPELRFWGAAQVHASRLGVTRTLVSITHDAGVAAAVVILEHVQ